MCISIANECAAKVLPSHVYKLCLCFSSKCTCWQNFTIGELSRATHTFLWSTSTYDSSTYKDMEDTQKTKPICLLFAVRHWKTLLVRHFYGETWHFTMKILWTFSKMSNAELTRLVGSELASNLFADLIIWANWLVHSLKIFFTYFLVGSRVPMRVTPSHC